MVKGQQNLAEEVVAIENGIGVWIAAIIAVIAIAHTGLSVVIRHEGLNSKHGQVSEIGQSWRQELECDLGFCGFLVFAEFLDDLTELIIISTITIKNIIQNIKANHFTCSGFIFPFFDERRENERWNLSFANTGVEYRKTEKAITAKNKIAFNFLIFFIISDSSFDNIVSMSGRQNR